MVSLHDLSGSTSNPFQWLICISRRGSTLLSTAALVYPNRFSGLVFTAVGYSPPAPFDLQSVNTMVKAYIGYPAFAYMEFFNEDGAAAICDSNPASVTSMLYSTTPEDWKAHMGTEGAAKEWVSSGKVSPPPTWMSGEEVATHVEIFKKGGYTGPLNWCGTLANLRDTRLS